ncbi:nucleoside-diphosphate kinase [Butyricicoccus faecihominis]|uniref:nucleoside-diphosphate kinase n=1 Tax=Butyricicoccus faecihominis TaxID=1712515 RepID=UPI00247A499E|nr:nucleoside-diphosphate kinase [Butyricicoccus faecihominis]MCQ5130015.1 nucleoside-diphosphate kinase [Butyricicoccus faecihominis]
MERTYIMLKPDALQRGLSGEILARIERKGYRITHMKTMQLDEAILREHYAHIADKPFFPETVTYMVSGPVLAMVVEGENAVRGLRMLMGPTKFEDAQPGTIRGDFAHSTTYNIIHGSDSPENAEIEIRRFFGDL